MNRYRAMSLRELAERLRLAEEGEARLRLLAEFLDEYRWEPEAARAELLAEEPATVGVDHWDAFLAGLAEHLSTQAGVRPPAWVEDPCRFLDRPWYLADHPLLWKYANADAPSAFRRRRVLVDPYDLARA